MPAASFSTKNGNAMQVKPSLESELYTSGKLRKVVKSNCQARSVRTSLFTPCTSVDRSASTRLKKTFLSSESQSSEAKICSLAKFMIDGFALISAGCFSCNWLCKIHTEK